MCVSASQKTDNNNYNNKNGVYALKVQNSMLGQISFSFSFPPPPTYSFFSFLSPPPFLPTYHVSDWFIFTTVIHGGRDMRGIAPFRK